MPLEIAALQIPLPLVIATPIAAAVGWLLGRLRSERRFETVRADLRAQLQLTQHELDERVLRIKQLEAQQQALERECEAHRRKIGELEIEIGRQRMRIVDLQAQAAAAERPAKQ